MDFILTDQSLTLDSGACRFSAWSGGTGAGVWTPVPVYGRNRMSNRPAYTGGVALDVGGTYSKTGGVQLDVMRVRSGANQGTQRSANVGASGDDYRGLPTGVYYLLLEPITGAPANTDARNGLYTLSWEERPTGNIG